MCGDTDKVEDASEAEVNRYGCPKKYDPKIKGPIKSRSCTDIVCCLVFLIFVAGMVACSIVGYSRGDPSKLIYPTDSFGNICGNGNYKDKPYLVFFDILQCTKMGAAVVTLGCPTPQICVSACPSTYWVYVQTISIETINGGPFDETERGKMICKYNVDPLLTASIVNLVENEDCAAYYVKSMSVINRCIPSLFLDFTDLATDLVYDYNGTPYTLSSDSQGNTITANAISQATYYLAIFYAAKEFAELIYKDVIASWFMILVGFGMSIILCLLWIVLMRWIAGIMVWLTIAILFTLFGFAIYHSYSEYYYLKRLNVTSEFGLSEAFQLNFSYYLSLKQTWLAFGCTTSTVTLILLLVLIFLVKQICLAIELIKEASRAVGSMFSTLLWPVFPFVCQVAFTAYWAVSLVYPSETNLVNVRLLYTYIASMGSGEYYSSSSNVTDNNIDYYLTRLPCDANTSTLGSFCDFVKYGGNEYIIPIQLFMLFMFLWIMNFMVALSEITLAGAFASHYWAWDKSKDIPALPLISSLYRALRYHMGSLAFGSFIIAVVQMIRIILEYIDRQLHGSKNKVAKFLLKCLKCCFWCLEKLLRFLNKNAYIIIAIRGRNFCMSAKDAFFLIMRNIVRVVVTDNVTDFVFFLSKLTCTAAVCVASFYWFKGEINWFSDYVQVPDLNYYLSPVIILTLSTYLVTCVFFSVYTMAVDTMFLCFLEDLEMNDGSPEKPYYMSKGLMALLGKKNKSAESANPSNRESERV